MLTASEAGLGNTRHKFVAHDGAPMNVSTIGIRMGWKEILTQLGNDTNITPSQILNAVAPDHGDRWPGLERAEKRRVRLQYVSFLDGKMSRL